MHVGYNIYLSTCSVCILAKRTRTHLDSRHEDLLALALLLEGGGGVVDRRLYGRYGVMDAADDRVKLRGGWSSSP